MASVTTTTLTEPRAPAEPLDVAAIGPRIRSLREAMGLSLRDLAERTKVSAPMLSQVERGETSPTLQVAARIAKGLDLTLSQLLRLDEDGAVTITSPSQRQRGGSARRGHSFEVLTALPRGSAPSCRGTRSPPAPRQAAPTIRRCTNRAAARRRSSRTARSCSSATAAAISSAPASA
jgi:transcriptional regulator with XRE-family HTH domain